MIRASRCFNMAVQFDVVLFNISDGQLSRCSPAVRKFGLAYCDFPTMLCNISFFLRAISLNVDPRNLKRIPLLYTILNIAFAASYCYVYLVSMIWFVFWRCMETGDVLLALIVFSLGASSEMGPYKIIFMFANKRKLNEIVAQCLACDALVEPGSRFFTNLMKTLRDVKKRVIIFWSIVMGNGVLYILKPILLPGRHLMEDFFVIYGLEPIHETPNYQIAFLVTAMGVCFTVFLAANAHAFQIFVTGYIEAQVLAWSFELTNIWEDAIDHYSKHKSVTDETIYNSQNFNNERNVIVNEFVNQRLKDIIAAHSVNLDLIQKMEDVFKGAIAVEFALLMICLIAELLGGLKNTYMQVPFALIQVGMECFIGQRLMDASLVFERAVYECKWENFDKDNMMLILTMVVLSQKTMTLSAGGVAKLNFMSFIGIIKIVYSAYTTLSATIE